MGTNWTVTFRFIQIVITHVSLPNICSLICPCDCQPIVKPLTKCENHSRCHVYISSQNNFPNTTHTNAASNGSWGKCWLRLNHDNIGVFTTSHSCWSKTSSTQNNVITVAIPVCCGCASWSMIMPRFCFSWFSITLITFIHNFWKVYIVFNICDAFFKTYFIVYLK